MLYTVYVWACFRGAFLPAGGTAAAACRRWFSAIQCRTCGAWRPAAVSSRGPSGGWRPALATAACGPFSRVWFRCPHPAQLRYTLRHSWRPLAPLPDVFVLSFCARLTLWCRPVCLALWCRPSALTFLPRCFWSLSALLRGSSVPGQSSGMPEPYHPEPGS